MTARHHHYLPQFYLKGFTKDKAKKSKLSVIDVKEKKSFETIPRNVGGIRDFNRVDIEGIDPSVVESALSQFEDQAATALKKLNENYDFSGETQDLILNLIALIAARSPERREYKQQFEAQIIEHVMGAIHDSKESWESQNEKLREKDSNYKYNVTYEQAKGFFKRKQYTIEGVREHQIQMEMVEANAILPYLFKRNWLLLTSHDQTGPFITTDWPVNLSWKEPDKYRRSPGFGLKSTEVYFPVSQNLALIGEFDGCEGQEEATEQLVAALNTKMLYNLHRQIYSPKMNFKFLGKNNELLSGKQLLNELST